MPFIVSALGGFLFGYDNGGIAGSLLFIRHDFALSGFATGIVVSSLILGAVLSAGIAGKLTDVYGPRRLLMAAGFILTIGSLSAALSFNVTMLVISRIIIGIGTGTATVQVPLYLSEMAPTRIRGALTSLFQIMIASGILVAFLVSYALAHTGAWRIMLGVAAAPSFVMFVGMWLQPESPRWLCRRGLVAEARAVLLQRRPKEEVDREVADMQRASARPDAPLHRLLQDRRIRRGMIVATLLTVLNDLTGITAVNYYAPTIFRAAGLGAANAILISVGLQVMTVGCTVVASLIVDAVGRRTLLLGGSLLMALAMGLLAWIFSIGGGLHGVALAIAVAGIALFKAAFALSWGPLLWVVVPELLPLRARGRGMGLATTFNWIGIYMIVLLFPMLLDLGASLVFLFFVVTNFAGFAFAFATLTETSRIPLEQLELGPH